LICSLVHKFGRRGGEATENDYDKYIEELKASLPADFEAKGNLVVFVEDCVKISPSQKSLENTGVWQKTHYFFDQKNGGKCLARIFEEAALLILNSYTLIRDPFFRKPVPAI
ncbi:MAG: hypothetical protein II966_08495, partial [Lachnospiraceae bacterium]|nr:hypothetical protein [Lachnospiraceae bacterium]